MTRFTSRAAPGVLLARVEEAAHALGGRTRRRDDTRCSPATLMLCLCVQLEVPEHMQKSSTQRVLLCCCSNKRHCGGTDAAQLPGS